MISTIFPQLLTAFGTTTINKLLSDSDTFSFHQSQKTFPIRSLLVQMQFTPTGPVKRKSTLIFCESAIPLSKVHFHFKLHNVLENHVVVNFPLTMLLTG